MQESKPTQAEINEAVAQAGGIETAKPLTEKQLKKKEEAEKKYWNSMITRREAMDLVRGALAQQDEKLRMMYITTNTLLSLVKDLGMADENKLNELAKPFIQMIYGPTTEDTEVSDDK